MAVIVTEPTVSDIYDMGRILKICRHFNVDLKVVINKFNLNPGKSREIESYLEKEKCKLIEKIPFTRKFVDARKIM